MERIRKFFKDEDGVTSLEYSLIAVVTCLVIVAAMVLIKPALQKVWGDIAAGLAA
jgi:Flp pilus assembly pilin Flp